MVDPSVLLFYLEPHFVHVSGEVFNAFPWENPLIKCLTNTHEGSVVVLHLCASGPALQKDSTSTGSAVTCFMNPRNMSHALCVCAVLLAGAPLPFVLENSSLQFHLVVW